MDNKPTEEAINNNKKKPPSQMIRDKKRLKEYRKRGKQNRDQEQDTKIDRIRVEKSTQTEIDETNEDTKHRENKSTQTEETEDKKSFWNWLIKTRNEKDIQQENYKQGNQEIKNGQEEKELGEEEIEEEEEEEKKEDQNSNSQPKFNPNKMYNILEINYKLTSLEDPKLLELALRFITRNLNEEGGKIQFPTLDEVDRIILKRNNLPTVVTELIELVDAVFERRKESLDLKKIYKQFVRAHGRRIFIPQEKWPNCYQIVKHA
jgi:hypothetical protein